MDFLEDPPFPSCPSFGFTSEPVYRVTKIVTSGGHSRRTRNWDRPLHRYSASLNPAPKGDVWDVLDFYHAVGGRAYGFRFLDYVDYKSCRIEEDTSFLDQPLVEISSFGDWQLTKVYENGILQQLREITKPIAGTITLADNGTQKTEGVDWDLDYTTGIVTLNFVPVGLVTWGGEFHVPVRFDSEVPIEIVNINVQSCQFVLQELRITDSGSES